MTTTKSFSYLDFLGRPTLVFTFADYLPKVDMNAKVIIEYSLQSTLIWIEPLYLICGLMLCFSLYLIFSKLDLTFGGEGLEEAWEIEQKRRAKLSAATARENVRSTKNKRR